MSCITIKSAGFAKLRVLVTSLGLLGSSLDNLKDLQNGDKDNPHTRKRTKRVSDDSTRAELT